MCVYVEGGDKGWYYGGNNTGKEIPIPPRIQDSVLFETIIDVKYYKFQFDYIWF